MSDLSKLWLVVIAEPDLPVAELDWFAELEALGRGDVAALARVRRLVTSQLSRMGAYAARDAWDDLA
ncbi:hypothetical protein K2X89_09375, partial [Myxococcota bacterium]|nr:hypothetical protein [Myxococcota bacterium]